MDRSKKILILSSIPVFLTLIFILYIVVPTVGKLNNLNKDLKQEKTTYAEAKDQLESLNSDARLLKKLNELRVKVGNFDVNVPSEDDLSILLIDLEKFAETFNVKVIGLSSKPESEKELNDPKKQTSTTTTQTRKKPAPSPLYSIPLEISAVGHYQNIVNFVNTLEKYERKIAIGNIKVENYKDDKDVPNPRVQMTINCEVYRFDAKNLEKESPKSTGNQEGQS